MPRYRNAYTDSARKTAVILTYTLIVLIIVLIVFMFFYACNQKKSSDNQNEIVVQANSVQSITPTEIPASETIAITSTPVPTVTPFVIAELPYGNPEDFGFSSVKLLEVGEFIQGQVDDGFPGAVLMIAKDGHIVFHEAYGYSKKYEGMNLLNQSENMQSDTMFDLASLSKIYATTFSIMKLVDEGHISLDGKVSEYLSNYVGANKDKVTVEMLLSHNAGYIQNYNYYKIDSQYKTSERNMVYNYVKQIPLDAVPGEEYDYNDIDYIILGAIVEEVSGMRIDEYAKTNIYEPLGLESEVTYRPLEIGIEKSNIAATERLGNTRDGMVYFDGIRQYTIQGEVHDENTYYSMDQVSGHAGLFATNYGLTVLNQVLLNNGEYGGVRIYKEETIENWMRSVNSSKYQLGFWNAKTASSRLKSCVSDSTFYHNGWTGTATIVDLENNLSIILLTNKRHSPCPDGDFQGTNYSIASYTPVIQKIYEAMDN